MRLPTKITFLNLMLRCILDHLCFFFKNPNNLNNFFQSKISLLATLVHKKATVVSMSGRPRLQTYNNFATIEWKRSACLPTNFSASSSISKRRLVAGVETRSSTYSFAIAIASSNCCFISILTVLSFMNVMSMPKKIFLSPLVVSIFPK